MKTIVAVISLALLAACQSAPKLEDDVRYVKMATVVDIHEFTETERKQAQANSPRDSEVGVGFSVGVGSGGGGSFGGVMLGIGSTAGGRRNSHDELPLIAKGANRYTVQPLGNKERIEVMGYGHYKVGDCVKVLVGHPTEFPRFFELKPGDLCE